MMRRYLWVGVITLLVIPAAWVAAEPSKVHQVEIPKNTFKLTPETITIREGDTVKWTNKDATKHNLASVPGSGPTDELEIFVLMEPGSVYEHTFKTAGEYPYFCFIHNQMTGHVKVVK